MLCAIANNVKEIKVKHWPMPSFLGAHNNFIKIFIKWSIKQFLIAIFFNNIFSFRYGGQIHFDDDEKWALLNKRGFL